MEENSNELLGIVDAGMGAADNRPFYFITSY
jgi:hypothetical protein